MHADVELPGTGRARDRLSSGTESFLETGMPAARRADRISRDVAPAGPISRGLWHSL